MSAFFLYSQAFRAQVKEENPEASFGEIVSHFDAAACSLGVLQVVLCKNAGKSVHSSFGARIVLFCTVWIIM
jgi:hypothetical protein